MVGVAIPSLRSDNIIRDESILVKAGDLAQSRCHSKKSSGAVYTFSLNADQPQHMCPDRIQPVFRQCSPVVAVYRMTEFLKAKGGGSPLRVFQLRRLPVLSAFPEQSPAHEAR